MTKQALKNQRIVTIDGVDLRQALPDEMPVLAVSSEAVKNQLRACWLTPPTHRPEEPPLSPRIVGHPGVGKTTVAFTVAKEYSEEVYIFQCTNDTRPEDLIITPVIDSGQVIRYHASPLATAMIRGGVCILDEGNRMSEKSWASLASLVDHRQCVESIVAGILIKAHPDFRCCVTMNEDASTYEVPDYILSRLQPTINVSFPQRESELAILRYHLPFAPAEMLALTVDFLQEAHQMNLEFSVRDGMHLLQYALKRLAQDPTHPLSKDEAWREALIKVLGEEALDLEGLSRRRKGALGDQPLPQGLGDFFFEGNDPLHPDR